MEEMTAVIEITVIDNGVETKTEFISFDRNTLIDDLDSACTIIQEAKNKGLEVWFQAGFTNYWGEQSTEQEATKAVDLLNWVKNNWRG